MIDQHGALRAAVTFRQAIRPAKGATDTMLSHLGTLLAETARIANDHAGPLSDGQEAIAVLGEVILDTIGMRGKLIRVHQAVAAAGARVLPELAWGDGENTEPKPLAAVPLRVAA